MSLTRHASLNVAHSRRRFKMSGQYSCAICNIQLNSETQLVAHIKGQKHQKRLGTTNEILVPPTTAQLFNEDINMENNTVFTSFEDQSSVSVDSPMCNQSLPNQHYQIAQYSNNLELEDASLLNISLTSSCCQDSQSLCVNPHPGSVKIMAPSADKNDEQVAPVEPSESINALPMQITALPTVEERLRIARDHSHVCDFKYDESFPKFPLDFKLGLLHTHLAFIGKDEPIPDLHALLT